MDPVIGGIVAAAGSALVNGVTATAKNHASYKYSKKLMNYQNKLNVENWQRVNDYNLPVNERMRLMNAGINPNFGSQSQSQPIAQVGASQFDASVPDVGASISDGINAYYSVKQADANVRKTEAEATHQEIQNDIDRKYGIPTAESNLTNINQSAKTGKSQQELNESNKATVDATRQPTVRKITSEASLNEENLKYIGKYFDLEERKTEVAEGTLIEMNRHNIAVEQLQDDANAIQAKKVSAEVKAMDLNTLMQNYLWTSGLFAEHYQNETDSIAKLISKYGSEIEHAGMTVGEVAGNLLNGLLGNSSDFVNKMFDYWTDENRKGKSFVGFLKFIHGREDNSQSTAPKRPTYGKKGKVEDRRQPRLTPHDDNHYGSGF